MAKDEITCAFFRSGWFDKTIKLIESKNEKCH